ncbi:uncharacterized protein V6R79_008638 [Siganus canaliculatus]
MTGPAAAAAVAAAAAACQHTEGLVQYEIHFPRVTLKTDESHLQVMSSSFKSFAQKYPRSLFLYPPSTADSLSKSSVMSVSIIKAVCVSNRIFHLHKKSYAKQQHWTDSFASAAEKKKPEPTPVKTIPFYH